MQRLFCASEVNQDVNNQQVFLLAIILFNIRLQLGIEKYLGLKLIMLIDEANCL